jgi:hypothetical protein
LINQASAGCARPAIAGVRTVIATHDESYEKKRRGSFQKLSCRFLIGPVMLISLVIKESLEYLVRHVRPFHSQITGQNKV